MAVLGLHAALGLALVSAASGPRPPSPELAQPAVSLVQVQLLAAPVPAAAPLLTPSSARPLARSPAEPFEPPPSRDSVAGVAPLPPASSRVPEELPADAQAPTELNAQTTLAPEPAVSTPPSAFAAPRSPGPADLALAAPSVAPRATPLRTAPDHGVCQPATHPTLLRERGVEGLVHLRVLIGADGRAREVQVATSSGWRLFDEAALVQARRCRYVPATEDGSPVDSWVEYPVRFALAS